MQNCHFDKNIKLHFYLLNYFKYSNDKFREKKIEGPKFPPPPSRNSHGTTMCPIGLIIRRTECTRAVLAVKGNSRLFWRLECFCLFKTRCGVLKCTPYKYVYPKSSVVPSQISNASGFNTQCSKVFIWKSPVRCPFQWGPYSFIKINAVMSIILARVI